MGEIAVAKKDQKGELQNFLGSKEMLESFKTVLPKFLTPERLVKACMVAASRTPKLYECTKMSLAQSLMRAAELGLDCSGTLGQGYLIPYGNTCQFITGYQGLIDLCRRTGELASIEARCVHEGDIFEREYGLENKLRHIPSLDCDDKPIIAAYAIAVLKDGSKQIEVMSKKQIDGIRARSKAGNSGPWVTDYEEMARKTVIRRLVKYLPKSVEIIKAIEPEEEMEYGDRNIKSVASSVVDTLKPVVKPQPEPIPQNDPQPISQDLPFPTDSEEPPLHDEGMPAQPAKPAESKPTDDAGRRQELGRIIAEFVKPQDDNDGNRLVLVNNRDSGKVEIENATEGVEEADLIAQSIAALSEFKGTNGWVNGATSIDGLKGKRLEITLRKARDLFQKSTAA